MSERVSPPGPGWMDPAIASFDWNTTPLGPMVDWSPALRAVHDLMMPSTFGMRAVIGPERTLIYNKAYAPFLGARHPAAIGQPFDVVWADVWPDVAPLYARAMAGDSVEQRDMRLVMTRNGYPEETFWTFGYSPIIEHDRVIGMLAVATDTTATVTASRQRALLNQELSHRLKNTLSVVQSIAFQTLRQHTARDALDAFVRRLHSLSTAHEALLSDGWSSATLGELIPRILANVGVADRYRCTGPEVALGAQATMSTSLLLHELATNAMKYGALSADGDVSIEWTWRGEGTEAELEVHWSERGGPAVAQPTRTGFGSRLVQGGLVGTGGADIRYGPLGLDAWFRALRSQVSPI